MNKYIYKKHFIRKDLGQNFLIDVHIIKDIISIINPQKGEILIEIGPGCAALTKPICDLINHLIVIEKDKNLLFFLKKLVFFPQLTCFFQDVLQFDYVQLFHEHKKLIRVFGNLPYNISIAILINLFKQIHVIKDMNFMLQKEVANRLVASPGNKLYGRISVLAQYYCTMKIMLNILPTSFFPSPKVHSVFINLTPNLDNKIFLYDIKKLSLVTNIAFQQRRKMLYHSLCVLFSMKRLIKLGINPKLRAENISVIQYCRLANYLSYKK